MRVLIETRPPDQFQPRSQVLSGISPGKCCAEFDNNHLDIMRALTLSILYVDCFLLPNNVGNLNNVKGMLDINLSSTFMDGPPFSLKFSTKCKSC